MSRAAIGLDTFEILAVKRSKNTATQDERADGSLGAMSVSYNRVRACRSRDGYD